MVQYGLHGRMRASSATAASTQGAWKLSTLGFSVKELIGGLDFWRRDGHPTVQGDLPGTLAANGATCGC